MNKISAEDYLTLVKAGYTAEEILKIGGNHEEPAEVKPEEPTEDKPEEPKEETPVESAGGPDLSEITNEIKSLKKMFEKYFINHDSFEQTKTDIANQILANVINPVREKKG